MKLCFFGSGVENESTNINNIEIESMVNIFIKKYKTLVYGGTEIGVMGDFASCFDSAGGKVVSIIPEWLYKNHKELINENNQVIKCKTLKDRKDMMIKDCDAILCYPGGLGTLDEFFTYLASVAVGENKNKCDIYLYNYDKFFSPLILQLEIAEEAGYISYDIRNKIKVFEYPSQLSKIIKS